MTSMFKCKVGESPAQQFFPVHTHIFTKRSEFLRAARSARWLVDPKKPVDLSDEDPEVFSTYVNLVYFGVDIIREEHGDEMDDDILTEVEELSAPESQEPTQDAAENEESNPMRKEELEDAFDMSVQECDKRAADRDDENTTPHSIACEAHYTSLSKLYILADKLGDLTSANLIIDEFIDSSDDMAFAPSDKVVNFIYESTAHGNPLRRLMRDIWTYETTKASYLDYHAVKLHADFIRDVMVESFRTRFEIKVDENCEHVCTIAQRVCADRCHYHQHHATALCPRCVPKHSASATPCAATISKQW
jgi:hypothetical protein